MQNLKPILLVEDDLVDAMTFKRALADLRVRNRIVHTLNGEEAFEYLNDESNEEPCFIFLDLNMPRMNGIEFLKVIKADSRLRKIPVIVLTTSDSEKDVIDSFEHSVAGYMLKPSDYNSFVEAMRTINLYWNLSKLPNGATDYEELKVQNPANRG